MGPLGFHTPPMVLEAIERLVDDVPMAAAVSMASAIASSAAGDWPAIRAQAQGALAHPHYRDRAGHFVDVWHGCAPALTPASMALALEAAAYSVNIARGTQALDLVWTGPQGGQGGTLRRIDQAMLQLINQAEQNLLIVTFTVYKVDEIRQALGRAIGRGVRLDVVVESPLESEGKVAYDALAALGSEVASWAQVYRWPLEARPVDDAGGHGLLHVKCAVADERLLLISSANLTAYALALNMEMGLLLTGGTLPRQVTQHFAALIRAGVLVGAR